MKLLGSIISGLLGLLMMAAVLLPSFHALTHDLNHEDVAWETNVSPVSIDCELCDFHFSSLDIPEYHQYIDDINVKKSVYRYSTTELIYLFPHSLFSLRAPPAVIA
ncbi:hypothetical protein BH23BAC2_BH23BAC2_05190 [soil metagenome]